MATIKQLESKQAELDVIKWTDSEKGADMCGTYDYCKNCDKNNDYPCARAYFAATAAPKATKAAATKTTKPAAKTTKKAAK